MTGRSTSTRAKSPAVSKPVRRPSEFSAKEWLLLKPLQSAFKQIRNDFLLNRYARVSTRELHTFLGKNQHLRGRNLVFSIAFERPWIIDWQLRMAKRNLKNAEILVLDNSRYPKERSEIAAVCHKHGTPYLSLPPLRFTRHPNRSHCMAMKWTMRNLIRPLDVGVFAFIDHDLIPVAPVDFIELLGSQPIYGLFKKGNPPYWHLWAGYCAYRLRDFPKRANPLYDFCRGLDTGGRLWDSIYRHLDPRNLRFAKDERVRLKPPGAEHSLVVQIIDTCWMHFEGIGYNDNFEKRGAFFHAMAEALDNGNIWQDFQVGQISS